MSDSRSLARRWDWIVDHHDPDVRKLARLAQHEPVLRALYAYSSHCDLKFSDKPEYPYEARPWIMSRRGEYVVCDANGDALAAGTAEFAVRRLAEEMSGFRSEEGS